MNDGRATTDGVGTTTKRFEGFDARFGTDANEIHVERRVTSPAYIRLRPGDRLLEGDAYHRERLGVDPSTLETWDVTGITADAVAGKDADGEAVTWDREEIETGRALGRYSTT